MPNKVSITTSGFSSSSSSDDRGEEEKRRKTMGRGRIEIKKIENVSSRQVTFSKRRAGLMKKARELAILCDAEVGVIIFSSTGKLYEFASSRLQNIISRYERNSDNQIPETQHEVDPEVEALKAEIVKLRKGQRLMMGKELEGLNYKELENLERQLHDGMLAVKNRKEMVLLEEIERSKLRGVKGNISGEFFNIIESAGSEQKTMQENEALKQQITEHLNRSTANSEICLVERKSPFIRPNPHAYHMQDKGDFGISLHLGLSPRDDHHERKIPKIEFDA